MDGVQIKTEEDSSPNNIRKVCENSLRNLGVETLGMFYQHRADPNTPIEVVAETVNELIREGKVLHFGLCEGMPIPSAVPIGSALLRLYRVNTI